MLVHWCGSSHFVTVDWRGETGAGSQGQVGHQGGVLRVVGLAGLAGLLLAEDHADLPVVAVPGRGGRAGQNNQASLTLKKTSLSLCYTVMLASVGHSPWVSRRRPPPRQHHVGIPVSSSLNPCGDCDSD